MIDHERIYLEPSPGADEDYGRQWCQHNVWDESTEYVRADLHEAAVEERDRLREIEDAMLACEVGGPITDVLANYRKIRRGIQDSRAATSPVEKDLP
jgi:hypothetical protein